jgi:hypothetical protein
MGLNNIDYRNELHMVFICTIILNCVLLMIPTGVLTLPSN